MSSCVVDWPAPTWSPPGADGDTVRYAIDVVTPMFGGGHTPKECDPAYPIRPAAVRGHLRFWWRALYGGRYATVADLAAAETDIWGSDTVKGKVALSVEPAQAGKAVDVFSWNRPGKFLSFPDLLQNGWPRYALFPFQGRKAKGADRLEEAPAKAQTGIRFALHVRTGRLSDHQKAEVAGAVAAWVHFGGVGARTRRGCGSLSCSTVGRPPRGELADGVRPQIPLLPGARQVLGNPSDNAVACWNGAVKVYADFRQSVPFARNPGSDPTKPNMPGRSKWPEPDSLRRMAGHWCPRHQPRPGPDRFPRADLGLPIVFHFKDNGEPDATLQGEAGHARMASPVITRPFLDSDGKWRPMILVLAAPHAWQHGDLELVGVHGTVGRPMIAVAPGAPCGPITGPIREAVLTEAAKAWKTTVVQL